MEDYFSSIDGKSLYQLLMITNENTSEAIQLLYKWNAVKWINSQMERQEEENGLFSYRSKLEKE